MGDEKGKACGDPGNSVFFQPVIDTLTAFSSRLTMLTDHGPNPPTINIYNCPQTPGFPGHFVCGINSYDSQGKTDIWWMGAGQSSTSTLFVGNCISGQPVYVSLTVTNPYGSTHKSSSFTCP